MENEMNESVDVKKVLSDLEKTEWSKDNESQGKAVSLLKGLAFSDDPLANAFMKELDKASTVIVRKLTSKNENTVLDIANNFILG